MMVYEGKRCLTEFEMVDCAYRSSDLAELRLMQEHVNECAQCGVRLDLIIFDRNPMDPESEVRKQILEANLDSDDQDH